MSDVLGAGREPVVYLDLGVLHMSQMFPLSGSMLVQGRSLDVAQPGTWPASQGFIMDTIFARDVQKTTVDLHHDPNNCGPRHGLAAGPRRGYHICQVSNMGCSSRAKASS